METWVDRLDAALDTLHVIDTGALTTEPDYELNLIDEHTRECLIIRAERRWSSAKVIGAMADVMVWKGVPEYVQTFG